MLPRSLRWQESTFNFCNKRKFKPGASYYYSGVISQMLEEPKKAKKYYSRIVKLKDDEDGVKKPSLSNCPDKLQNLFLRSKIKKKLKS